MKYYTITTLKKDGTIKEYEDIEYSDIVVVYTNVLLIWSPDIVHIAIDVYEKKDQ